MITVLERNFNMTPYPITIREEYDYCRQRNIEPLAHPSFHIEINLRVQIQRELFGMVSVHKNIAQANQRFYEWAWEHSRHYCEECMLPLRQYSAGHISHILTRGAHIEMAHDFRNKNILCAKHHAQWETGDRKSMRIYTKNAMTIDELRNDYKQLNEN